MCRHKDLEVTKGDVLVIQAAPEAIEGLAGALKLKYAGTTGKDGLFAGDDMSLLEVVVPEGARAAGRSAISLKLIKKGLLMARGEASLEALMDFEIEACLACVSTKEREESLKTFEERKRT